MSRCDWGVRNEGVCESSGETALPLHPDHSVSEEEIGEVMKMLS